jgi:hypothetical protein
MKFKEMAFENLRVMKSKLLLNDLMTWRQPFFIEISFGHQEGLNEL